MLFEFRPPEKVGDLEMFKRVKKRKKPKPVNNTTKTRQVELPNPQNYILIRPGSRTFASHEELTAAAEANELQEDMFFLYRHKDDTVLRRSAEVPVWEACFCLCPSREAGGTKTIRAQKSHLRQAYTNSGRTNSALAWSFLSVTDGQEGPPYWVDRYAFCKMNQRDTKRRYEHAHKRVKK